VIALRVARCHCRYSWGVCSSRSACRSRSAQSAQRPCCAMSRRRVLRSSVAVASRTAESPVTRTPTGTVVGAGCWPAGSQWRDRHGGVALTAGELALFSLRQ
jgi:hypothetical protein